jgi:pSer/pThr/pTyr-binding forkhead associated (FHA) protein
MAYLIQKCADTASFRQWDLDGRRITVGRGEEVDIRIDDQKMSRVHFLVEDRNGRYIIEDQKSSNGTWVNDRRITSVELSSEDRILAGGTQFVFQSGFGSMIQRLADAPRSYTTQMRKISPDGKPRTPG